MASRGQQIPGNPMTWTGLFWNSWIISPVPCLETLSVCCCRMYSMHAYQTSLQKTLCTLLMYRGALKPWFEALILGQPFFLSICVICILNCSPGRVHARGTCAAGRNAMTCISDEEILQNYAHVPARLSLT